MLSEVTGPAVAANTSAPAGPGVLAVAKYVVPPPAVVTDATAEYFAAEDAFGLWLEDDCEVKVGGSLWDRTGDLFDSWSTCCRKAGDDPGTKKAFNSLLSGRGFVPCRKGDAGTRCFSGLRLKLTEADTDD